MTIEEAKTLYKIYVDLRLDSYEWILVLVSREDRTLAVGYTIDAETLNPPEAEKCPTCGQVNRQKRDDYIISEMLKRIPTVLPALKKRNRLEPVTLTSLDGVG